jgi:hypothetical protein
MAAVNTGVFTISGHGLFTVSPYAQYAIATSSAFTGLGLTIDAWFLFRYHWQPTHIVIVRSLIILPYIYTSTHIRTPTPTQRRALDVYSSYFFFSLSARIPVICMLTAAISLTSFLALVAYDAWPTGVLVMCFLCGLVMSLQFLVYGVHWVGKVVVEVVRMVKRGVGVVGKGVAGVGRWVGRSGGKAAS